MPASLDPRAMGSAVVLAASAWTRANICSKETKCSCAAKQPTDPKSPTNQPSRCWQTVDLNQQSKVPPSDFFQTLYPFFAGFFITEIFFDPLSVNSSVKFLPLGSTKWNIPRATSGSGDRSVTWKLRAHILFSCRCKVWHGKTTLDRWWCNHCTHD